MGSISNSLNNLNSPVTSSNSSSSSNPSGIFTGTSVYSQDFQNIINRAVAIASLPINLLTGQQAALTNQSAELTTLDTLFTKLQTAIRGIGTAMSGSSFQTDYSIADVVSATLGEGAIEGVYSIHVDNPGTYASSLSSETWDSTSAAGGGASTYTLVVGAQEYAVTPADNSAQSVTAAINSQYGSLVHAVAVNVGSTTAPDYRISLQSATLGPMNLDLVQIPTGASTTSLQGASAPASYSTSLSAAGWQSTGGPFSLIVGGVSHAITTSDTSALGVAAAINAQYGDLVEATAVNAGTPSAPDYRVYLRSATPGSSTLDLKNSSETGLQQQGAAVSCATSQSAATWNAAADSAGTRSLYTLVVGSVGYSFAPADNSAASVAAAINSQFSSVAQATVVNLGTAETPDYRISLRSATQGSSVTLDIQKTTATSYQAAQTTGALAQYAIDGGPTNTSGSRSIAVSEGVTLTLQNTGSTDVTVTRATSALSTALSAFADAYNAAFDALAKQRGESAGPLAGQSIVSILSQTLSGIATYGDTSGALYGLQSLGLTLGTEGHLTYNAFSLMAADLGNPAGVSSFLGSATGGGFLQAATAALGNLEDPTTGLLKNAETGIKNQITRIGNQISAKQVQMDQLQKQLTSQMAAADALIASMEQQYTYITNMFQAQQTAEQMYK